MKNVVRIAAIATTVAMSLAFTGPSRAADNDALSIAYPGFSTTAMLTYLAEAQGFYKQVGLDMKILDGQGANSLTLVVSGQVDIYGAGPISAALATAVKGAPTTAIYAVTGGGQAGYVVGSPKTAPTLEALGKLDTCRINTFAAGTTAYAFAVKIKQAFAPKCEIVPFSDIPSALASLVSGHGDAVVTSYSTVVAAINAKQVVTILDTRDPAANQKAYGAPFIESSDWGMTANLEKKRPAVVKYIRASVLAWEWLKSHSDQEAAVSLQTFAPFKSQPLESVTAQVMASRSYLFQGSANGRIEEAQWKRQLEFLVGAGMVPDPQSPENTFAKRVDLTYFDAAVAKK